MNQETCQKCGVILSLPSGSCQNCGHAMERTEFPQTTLPWETDSVASVFTPPRAAENSPQAANVDRLLGQIAAQSHFEDRYEVHGELASGGMGQVMRAYDRILQRDVAIKMMRDTYDSGGVAIRGQFLKEARVGGRLLHPHVLAVFDLGVNRAGQIYYTMRLVDGASLQQCLESVDKGVMTKLIGYPLRKIVAAFCGACEGVDYAHENGVIHLDLKPHNILMSGFSEVFVIDWGLARVDEVDDTEALLDIYRDAEDAEHHTASSTGVFGGHVVGTPGYMSPEQAQGRLRDFNPATDVYGLGGVLYYILYGQSPNHGRSAMEALAATMQRKERGKLRSGVLPKGRRIAAEVRDAIDALERICLKALEPEQTERYADAGELIVELNEWLEETRTSPLAV